MRSREHLKQYLPAKQHRYFDQVAGREQLGLAVGARPSRSFYREDTFLPNDGQPGSDLRVTQEQLLDRYGIDRGILTPLDQYGVPASGELSRAVARAINEWQAEEWLSQDERLYGSIVVSLEDGHATASEIARAASNPRFVQLFLLVPTADPLGHPRYWPIYEAAAEAGLPLALHPGGFSGMPLTGAGWPTYFFEYHVSLPFAYPVEVVSLIYSGVFDRLPELQFVLQEGAISWMIPLMARMDRAYAAMKEDVPHLKEAPSELARRHFWFTTQPLEEPTKPHQLLQMFDQLGMNDHIMFASDYPHWDFDAPDRALPSSISGELRSKIFAGNAESLYKFTSAQ
jgi:hypothetical protein